VHERVKLWASWPTLSPAGPLYLRTSPNLAATLRFEHAEDSERSFELVDTP
jgi:hypothetical protein